MTGPDRERLIEAARQVLRWADESGIDREHRELAALRAALPAEVEQERPDVEARWRAIYAQQPETEPEQEEYCPGCGAPAGFPPAGPCKDHGSSAAIAGAEPEQENEDDRTAFMNKLRAHHQVVRSDSVSFIAKDGKLIPRPAGMSDADWWAMICREMRAEPVRATDPKDDPMPVFVIKAKDNLAVRTIEWYARECSGVGLEAQAREVDLAVAEIRAWRERHSDLCQLPDHKHVPVAGGKERVSTEERIQAAALEAADFLPAYPDGGRTARACAERVLAGAGFFDIFDELDRLQCELRNRSEGQT